MAGYFFSLSLRASFAQMTFESFIMVWGCHVEFVGAVLLQANAFEETPLELGGGGRVVVKGSGLRNDAGAPPSQICYFSTSLFLHVQMEKQKPGTCLSLEAPRPNGGLPVSGNSEAGRGLPTKQQKCIQLRLRGVGESSWHAVSRGEGGKGRALSRHTNA